MSRDNEYIKMAKMYINKQISLEKYAKLIDMPAIIAGDIAINTLKKHEEKEMFFFFETAYYEKYPERKSPRKAMEPKWLENRYISPYDEDTLEGLYYKTE